MTSGFHGKVQRSFWISTVAAEKLTRLVLARGGRCSPQVAEEAIHLLYKSDPLMADMPPIPDDPVGGPVKAKPPAAPRDDVDRMLDLATVLQKL